MAHTLKVWTLLLTAMFSLMAQPSIAADGTEGVQGRLASVGWLKKNLLHPDVVLIDASPAQLHRQQHIPGAVHSELFTFGSKDLPLAQFEASVRAWGVSPGQQIVLYDQGGTYMATRWLHRSHPLSGVGFETEVL